MNFLPPLTFGLLFGAAVLTLNPAPAAESDPLTPTALQAELKSNPGGRRAEELAKRIRGWFGKENLLKGPNPKINDLEVAWAVEAPEAKAAPLVASTTSDFRLPLRRIGKTDVYAAAVTLPEGTGMAWSYEINGEKKGGGQLEVYTTPPENKEQPGVPKGTLTQQPKWKSNLFAGTERDWWVYVPAQYTPDKPAAVMVFQDGQWAKNYIPVVFDNLIAKGEMPVTVGVFVSPGTFANGRSNRSFEYDTLSDQYARFLLEEILPEVEKTMKLRQDAAGRAIGGLSSGGIASWTAAWERPDAFSKVLSWIGSYTNIASGPTRRAGGHNYPALIRKTPKKPIRIFLQEGMNDLDNAHGNWPLANLQMEKALQFAGYDYKGVFGQGFHNDKHGRALLPESLRWLWRDVR
ncbi:MAG: enterochelin esterase [Armatimonadetes bacterium]|nr:enterochelin esterase [Armatimonadota bacterium]